MSSHEWDISNAPPPRCKCTGPKAQRPNLLSRERWIRWTLLWPFCLLLTPPSGFLHCKADGKWQEGEVVFPRPGEENSCWDQHLNPYHPSPYHFPPILTSLLMQFNMGIFMINSVRCAWKERSIHWCSQMAPSPSPSTSRRPLTLDDTSDKILQIRMTSSAPC